MKTEFFEVLKRIYQILRDNDMSYQGIADVMDWIYPREKDVIMNVFNDSVDKTDVPAVEDVNIVHYDELP